MTARPPNRDKRIDAYIATSAEFARPILTHLRALVHEGCPDVQECIKWGMPSFEYKGLLCGMAAFKQHCSFGFWKHALVVGPAEADGGARAGVPSARDGMGEFGRITRVADLPARRVLIGFVRKAAKLNDDGVKIARAPRAVRRELVVPPDLAAALRKRKPAASHFAEFSYSKRKDYIEWLTEARTDATRARRLATAIEWIAEGKSRNWKYERPAPAGRSPGNAARPRAAGRPVADRAARADRARRYNPARQGRPVATGMRSAARSAAQTLGT